MRIPAVTYLDFETLPIQKRPEYPPRPVSFSIERPGWKAPKFFSWGHKTGGNNCSRATAKEALMTVFREDSIVCQNAQFDISVAVEHMGMPMPSWERIHDTMFGLFLYDPHAPNLQLKPSAERILGIAPEEKEQVEDWLWSHVKQLTADFDLKKYDIPLSRARMGAFVAFAPGTVVEAYCNGDVFRTKKLFEFLWKWMVDNDQMEAYNREREIMPILLENERIGIKVDEKLLEKDIDVYSKALVQADKWLTKRLSVPGKKLDISFDNDTEVANALSAAGIIDDDKWILTPTGKRSVAKKNLTPDMYNDVKVANVFGYRNRLTTCLKMFMLPWYEQLARRGDGHISTNWNQVRQPGGGTRTGRPSTSDPNFLNISKSWDDRDDGFEPPEFLEPLPLVRKYILPDDGDLFLHRDFDGQELRILGHFEDGPLMAAYLDDPHLDVHDYVRQLIEDIAGLSYHRRQVKITNFRRIYGGGVPATAGALNVSAAVAKELLDAHGAALPGLGALTKRITDLARSNQPIETWGGRLYYEEPPKMIGRRMVNFRYKLLNYLIQGSAADATKEAIIRWYNHPKRDARFLVTVYDEINISANKHPEQTARQMRYLRESMEGLEFDVPMLSSSKVGANWGALKKYEDK